MATFNHTYSGNVPLSGNRFDFAKRDRICVPSQTSRSNSAPSAFLNGADLL